MSGRSRAQEPNAGGVGQHRGVLIAAVVLGSFGIIFPIAIAGDHALAATPYSIVGGVAGSIGGGLSLRLRPVSSGTRIMIVALFVGLLVLTRLGGGWMFAVPPFVLASFAAACIGSHLRYRAFADPTKRAV